MTTKQVTKKVLTGIKKRVLTKTPKKYVKLRNICLIAAGVGGFLMAPQLGFPVLVIKIGGWLFAAGNAAAGVVHSLEEYKD